MLVSILMSIHNGEKHLVESINSILHQTYKNLEIIICDDFSNDNTLKICKEYEKKDSRIKIVTNKQNLGLTKSLNNLIEQSVGELIARQDADDISDLNRIKEQVNYIKNLRYDFTTTRAKDKDTGRFIPKYSNYLPKRIILKLKNPLIHGSLMIRKDVLLKIGKYDENFYYAQDYKLFKDLFKAGYRHKYIKEPLYLLNMKDNISNKFKIEQHYYANCVKRNKLPTKRTQQI
jgi:glycosyltransferase EpsE